MSLQISEKEVDGITIVQFQGRLELGPEASSLQDKIPQLEAEKKNRIIFDLEGVSHIDSTGLGILVYAHSVFQKAGGALKLLHLSERNLELLILTKLSAVFETFDDEQAAIDSFFPEREIKHFDILEFVKSQDEESSAFGADEQDEDKSETEPASPTEASESQDSKN